LSAASTIEKERSGERAATTLRLAAAGAATRPEGEKRRESI